jgi:repressor LexA
MHPTQEKLLKLTDQKNIGHLTLREIGALIGEKQPQAIKHHLSQLERKGFIVIDKKKKTIVRVGPRSDGHRNADASLFVSIPILGSANCGPATIFADENIEGYLKISKRLVSGFKSMFAIKADGNSLNRAKIGGKQVETGDYVLIDSSRGTPKDGDYVLSIIDGLATIKKYRLDKKNDRIALLSESSQDYAPIFIHEDDDFRVNGTAVEVVKRIV